jgi:hypothetical protein
LSEEQLGKQVRGFIEEMIRSSSTMCCRGTATGGPRPASWAIGNGSRTRTLTGTFGKTQITGAACAAGSPTCSPGCPIIRPEGFLARSCLGWPVVAPASNDVGSLQPIQMIQISSEF